MDVSPLKIFAGGAVTAAVLCYSHIGMETVNADQDYYFHHAQAPEGMSFDYYQIINEEQSKEVEQFKIIQSFASNLIENIKDLDPEFSRTVDKHFWDLV